MRELNNVIKGKDSIKNMSPVHRGGLGLQTGPGISYYLGGPSSPNNHGASFSWLMIIILMVYYVIDKS